MILQAPEPIAEINPALRHQLRSLYDLELPETVDLSQTDLDAFFTVLQSKIQASDPSVGLNKIDRPQIEMTYETARKSLDDFRRRRRLSGRGVRHYDDDIDYCYQSHNFQSLGLQLYLKRVEPPDAELKDLLAEQAPNQPAFMAPSDSLPPGMSSRVMRRRNASAVRQGSGNDPHVWDFDLCSTTLANFNYRKMTLVRDYNEILEADIESDVFDEIFDQDPADVSPPPDLPSFIDQRVIVPCDPTQLSAVSRARASQSYIIQGPPGTGKSQTITNLIADFVGRDQQVLSVCEKRVALDVVFHRLKQQGLDELAVLIHDSQKDKKPFVMNLKETFERFRKHDASSDITDRSKRSSEQIESHLRVLQTMDEALGQPHEALGVSPLALYRRLVALGPQDEPPENFAVTYPMWQSAEEVVRKLEQALQAAGLDLRLSQSPLHLLAGPVLAADLPTREIEQAARKAEQQLAEIAQLLEISELTVEAWDSLALLRQLSAYAQAIHSLAAADLLELLAPRSELRKRYNRHIRDQQARAKTLKDAQAATKHWRDPLTRRDAETAHHQARGYTTIMRFLSPGFWKLRRVMNRCYDFSQHAIAPTWTQLLEELIACHQAQEQLDAMAQTFEVELGISDLPAVQKQLQTAQSLIQSADDPITAFHKNMLKRDDPAPVAKQLAELEQACTALEETLQQFIFEHQTQSLAGLPSALQELVESLQFLPEVLPELEALQTLDPALQRALRLRPMAADQIEAAAGLASLEIA